MPWDGLAGRLQPLSTPRDALAGYCVRKPRIPPVSGKTPFRFVVLQKRWRSWFSTTFLARPNEPSGRDFARPTTGPWLPRMRIPDPDLNTGRASVFRRGESGRRFRSFLLPVLVARQGSTATAAAS